MRGDHTSVSSVTVVRPGLPPRARGSPVHVRVHRHGAGPTPACAGITRTAGLPSRPNKAYPRVRGDHTNSRANNALALGLPPRARGSLGGPRCG